MGSPGVFRSGPGRTTESRRGAPTPHPSRAPDRDDAGTKRDNYTKNRPGTGNTSDSTHNAVNVTEPPNVEESISEHRRWKFMCLCFIAPRSGINSYVTTVY